MEDSRGNGRHSKVGPRVPLRILDLLDSYKTMPNMRPATERRRVIREPSAILVCHSLGSTSSTVSSGYSSSSNPGT